LSILDIIRSPRLCALTAKGCVKTTVLVVEDDADIRNLLCRALRSAGYLTRSESDGRAALAAIRRDPPDLVLLDYGLPGMNGIDVCRALRGPTRSAGPPVVLISGHVRTVDIERGLAAGADDYITKPFSPRRLIERLPSILGPGVGGTGPRRPGSRSRLGGDASPPDVAPVLA
jgi:DNA-binding response OmpR family regulator